MSPERIILNELQSLPDLDILLQTMDKVDEIRYKANKLGLVTTGNYLYNGRVASAIRHLQSIVKD